MSCNSRQTENPLANMRCWIFSIGMAQISYIQEWSFCKWLNTENITCLRNSPDDGVISLGFGRVSLGLGENLVRLLRVSGRVRARCNSGLLYFKFFWLKNIIWVTTMTGRVGSVWGRVRFRLTSFRSWDGSIFPGLFGNSLKELCGLSIIWLKEVGKWSRH